MGMRGRCEERRDRDGLQRHGGTHGGSRFDHVFYSKASALALKSVNVPDSRINGVYPSDHDPVIATFAVN